MDNNEYDDEIETMIEMHDYLTIDEKIELYKILRENGYEI